MNLKVVLVVAAMISPVAAARAEGKIAIIDLKRAIVECKAGLKAKNELKRDMDRRMIQLGKQQNDLDKLRTELAGNRAKMDPSAIAKAEQEETRKSQELMRALEQEQGRLRAKEQELLASIETGLKAVMQQLVERDQLELVLDKQSVVWSRPGLELTNELIKASDSAPSRE